MQQKFDKSNPEHDNPYHLFSKQQKVHPVIEYFRQLQRESSALQLEKFLSVFAEPKLINCENFVEGVKRFGREIGLGKIVTLGSGSQREIFKRTH